MTYRDRLNEIIILAQDKHRSYHILVASLPGTPNSLYIASMLQKDKYYNEFSGLMTEYNDLMKSVASLGSNLDVLMRDEGSQPN